MPLILAARADVGLPRPNPVARRTVGYKSPMLRQGPIPHFLHGLIEYLGGAALIVLPFVIGYDSGTAKAVSIVLGVLVIFIAAASDSPTGLSKSIPVAVHVLLDYTLVVLLIASPFLFGFSDETDPTAVFITIGVLHLLVSVATRFKKTPPGDEGGSKRRGRRERKQVEAGESGDSGVPEFELPPRSERG
jgi:VIT1/CCC1 family predicted Fe2+/Mn2+ transporter